jgi:hypothetical protein
MSNEERGPLQKLDLQGYNFQVEAFYGREDGRDSWVLDAPYQRGRLWGEEQNRNLIKSLLQGIPIGVIFSNRRSGWDFDRYVVDGKQRIGAIRDFVEGNLEVPSGWFEDQDLKERKVGDGWVRYEDLSERGKRGFDRCTVAVAESRLPSLEREAELYLLVNFGGVAQTEIDKSRAKEIAENERELIG